MTIWRMRVSCRISKATRTEAHTSNHALTHASTRHASTHTQKYIILFALPRQQWIHERAPVLHNTCIACIGSCIYSDQNGKVEVVGTDL